MNAQTQNMPAQMNSVGLLNLDAFELSQRVAKMLASSTLVPEQYRAITKVKAGKDNNGQWVYQDVENPNGLSNCVIALNMANRMGADPLMIMQNLYLIEGRPSWSSQFIMASINSCGRFSSLRFEIEDLGEKEVEYQDTAWVNNRKQTTTKKIKIQNISCVAWVIERESGERLESSKISIEMAVKEGWYQKNGSKWQTMPEQMLRYRAASFFGRVYAPELLMGLRSADEEQDRIIDITPEEKTVAPDYSQLKRKILAVKSPAELDVLEEEVFNITDEEPRKELMKLANAQAKKFQPATSVENDQNSASNDVEEKTFTSQSNIEIVSQGPITAVEDSLTDLNVQAEPAEEVQAKKPTSAELRKEYLVSMSKAKNLEELDLAYRPSVIKGGLTVAHEAYLKSTYLQLKEKFKPAVQPAKEEQQTSVVNEIKSNAIAGGLKTSIQDALNLEVMAEIAQTIRDNKPNLTTDHMAEILQVYGARKTFLENQQDMFEEDTDVTWTDSAIKRIEAAKNQDDINAVYLDPEYDEQSDKDKQRLDIASQKREAELFG